MKKWLGLLFAVAAVQTLTLTDPVAEASPKGLRDGFKVALQTDTGGWFTRCRGCQNTVVDIPDTVTVHASSPMSIYAQFEVVDVGGGKIALKSDTGKYVARCEACIRGGANPDFLVIHATNPSSPYAQFTPVLLRNGKYALRADTGKYVARCEGCSPGAAHPNTVTIHAGDPASPYAQWNIIPIL